MKFNIKKAATKVAKKASYGVTPAHETAPLTKKQMRHTDETMAQWAKNGGKLNPYVETAPNNNPYGGRTRTTAQGLSDARLRSKRQIQVAKGRAAQRNTNVAKGFALGTGAATAGLAAGKAYNNSNARDTSMNDVDMKKSLGNISDADLNRSSWSNHKRQQRGY